MEHEIEGTGSYEQVASSLDDEVNDSGSLQDFPTEEPDVEEFKAQDNDPEEGDGIDGKLEDEDIPWLEGAQKKELVYPDYNPVNALLTKLELWLLQQPEWAVILSAPRKTRRQAINLVSKRLLTIPNRYS